MREKLGEENITTYHLTIFLKTQLKPSDNPCLCYSLLLLSAVAFVLIRKCSYQTKKDAMRMYTGRFVDGVRKRRYQKPYFVGTRKFGTADPLPKFLTLDKEYSARLLHPLIQIQNLYHAANTFLKGYGCLLYCKMLSNECQHQFTIVCKGESPEVLVTLGLGGWVSLGPYFLLFGHRKNIIFLGVFIHFWHILGTRIGQRLVPCGRVPILKVPYWNRENYDTKRRSIFGAKNMTPLDLLMRRQSHIV